MTDTQEIISKLVEKAVELYPGKIAVIALYGSVALDTSDEYSDIDMYAIVDDARDTDLPWEFVTNGIPIGFWKMNWLTAELMAQGKRGDNPWAVSAAVFANCKILYSRSEEDKLRFESIREKMNPPDDERLRQIMGTIDTYCKFAKRVEKAKERNDLLSAKWAAWHLINDTVKHLSLLNNRFLTKNWGAHLPQVFDFPLLPDNYQGNVKILITSQDFDEIIVTGKELIKGMRELIQGKEEDVISSARTKDLLCKDYPGIKTYLNKIRSACRKKDVLVASYYTTELQVWLTHLLAESGGKVADMDRYHLYDEMRQYYDNFGMPDLFGFAAKEDFEGLEKAVDSIDDILKERCEEHDMTLKEFLEKKNR